MNRTLLNMWRSFRCGVWTLLTVCLWLLTVQNAWAGNVHALRIGQGVGSVRLVFDADSKFDYNVFLLTSPKRLVVDVKDSKVHSKIEKNVDKNTVLSNIRVGKTPEGDARIAFDLKQPAIVKKAFMLPPQSSFGWRFVIDMDVSTEKEFAAHVGNQHAFVNNSASKSKSTSKSSNSCQDQRDHVSVPDLLFVFRSLDKQYQKPDQHKSDQNAAQNHPISRQILLHNG